MTAIPSVPLRAPPPPSARVRRGPLRPERLTPVRARMDRAGLQRMFRTVDAVVAVCAALAAAGLAGDRPLWLQAFGAAAPTLLQAAAALAALASVEGYRFGRREPAWLQPLRLAVASAAGFAVAGALSLLVPGGDPREALAGAAATSLALVVAHAWAAVRIAAWRRDGRLTPNVVVVGATEDAGRLIARALRGGDVHVLGLFDDRADRAPAEVRGVPVLGDTAALLEHRLLPYVDRVVIAVSAASQARVRALAARLRVLPNAVVLFADLGAERGRSEALARLADAPLAAAHPDGARAFAKRLQDLAFSALALALLAPAIAAVALAVRLDSPGPVLFRQRRHGFNDEPIQVWKFRSMHAGAADPAAGRQTEPDDPRVTRVGRFIRRTSLDELPQLLNVFRGEMSLVGPRPHAIGMKTAGADTRAFVDEYAWRHRMKPGLTGWAQVNGSRGPVHTPEAVRRRVALDLAYIERQSFWFDVWILLLTLPRLLGDGAALR